MNAHDYSNWSRRQFFAVSAGMLPLGALQANDEESKTIAGAAQFARGPDKANWGPDQLHDFLGALPDEGRLSLKQALEIVKQDATVEKLKGKGKDVAEIKDNLLWACNNTFVYPFKDKECINYHEVVCWVAEKSEVSKSKIEAGSTFAVEHAIMQQLFVSLWDKLDADQRRKLLDEIDPERAIQDREAMIAHAGRDALWTLMRSVKGQGFKFYVKMSQMICMVAGWFGVTLPFAAYTGAARLVAFLTGPVGWAILAVLTAAELWHWARANPQKTLAFVLQLHLLRVAALRAAGQKDDEVFPPSVRFPGGGRLEANREAAGEWEQFTLTKNMDGTYSFAAYTGYLCAEAGGAREAVANRDRIGDWERWKWIDHPDGSVSLQTIDDRYYLCAQGGDSKSMLVNREKIGDWEKFIITKSADGKTCTIKTAHGYYVSAQP